MTRNVTFVHNQHIQTISPTCEIIAQFLVYAFVTKKDEVRILHIQMRTRIITHSLSGNIEESNDSPYMIIPVPDQRSFNGALFHGLMSELARQTHYKNQQTNEAKIKCPPSSAE